MGRRLPLWGWAALVVAYLALLEIVTRLVATERPAIDELRSNEDVLLGYVIPISTTLLFAAGVTTFLGWWRPVLVERRRTQRWVLIVPAIFVVFGLLAIDHGELAGRPASFVLLFMLTFLLVGAAEELMFRGIGVHVLRQNGLTEAKVALWSSVIFGVVHLSNALDDGGRAVFQALLVSFGAYFFYLTRRATGGLLVGVLIHGLLDFALLSGQLATEVYVGTVAALLIYPVVGIVVFVRRRRIEPGSQSRPLTSPRARAG